MFLARSDEQERFSALLMSLAGAHGEAARAASHVLLIQGLGGMGKTWLMERYAQIARDFKPPGANLASPFSVVALNWEDERNRGAPDDYPASTGPRLVTVLAALYANLRAACIADGDKQAKRAERAFITYRDVLARLPEIEARMNVDNSAEDPRDAATLGPRAAPVARASGLANAVAEVAQRRRRTRDRNITVDVTLRPEDALIRAFADGVRQLSGERPLVLLLDTYEIVASCGGWLRLAMTQTGDRVLWVLAGRLEPEASAGADSETAAFYRELDEDKLRVISMVRFSDGTITELLANAIGEEKAQSSAADVATVTHGVPLAVGLVAGLLSQGDDIHDALASVTDSGDASKLVRELAHRYLVHARKDPVLGQDIPLLYGLALLRGDRSDPDLLRALWDTEGDMSPTLDGLAQRHDFVLSISRRLHQEVRDAFRRFLLDTVIRDEQAPANERAAGVMLARALAGPNEALADRYADEQWRSTVAALVWHRFWVSNQLGFETLLEVFPGAAVFQSSFAHELVGLTSWFYETFTPAERSVLRGLASMLSFGGFLDTWLARRRSSLMPNRALAPFVIGRDESTDEDRRVAVARLGSAEGSNLSGLGVSHAGLASLLVARSQARQAPGEALRALNAVAGGGDHADPNVRDLIGSVAREVRQALINDHTEGDRASLEGILHASRIATEYRPDDVQALLGLARAFSYLARNEETASASAAIIDRFSDREEASEEVACAYVLRGTALLRLGCVEEAIAAFDEAQRRFGDAESVALQVQAIGALLGKGEALDDLGRHEEEAETFAEAFRQFGDSSDARVRRQAVKAAFNLAITLGRLDRREEQLRVYEDIRRRYGEATESEIRDTLARASVNYGVALGAAGRTPEAIAVYDDAVEQFGADQQLVVQEQVVVALWNRALSLERLERHAEMLDAYDDLARRYADSVSPRIRDIAARARVNRAAALLRLDRVNESLSANDATIRWIGDTTQRELLVQLAMAFTSKATALRRLGQAHAEIATYDEFVRRLGDAQEPDIRNRLATALLNKSVTLSRLGEKSAMLEVYDELVQRFGDDSDPRLQTAVATAIVRTGAALLEADRIAEALGVFDDLIGRFGDTPSDELQVPLGRAHFQRAVALERLGETETAVAAFAAAASRCGDSASTELRLDAANSLGRKGLLLDRLGRTDEAIEALMELVHRFDGDRDPKMRDNVAISLWNVGLMHANAGRSEDALNAHAEVVRRYRDDDDPDVRQHVAQALTNQASWLSRSGRPQEALGCADEFLERLKTDGETAFRRELAIVLTAKAGALEQLGRGDDALEPLATAVDRFADAEEPELRASAVTALVDRAAVLTDLGRTEEVLTTYDELVRRFGTDPSPATRTRVMGALWAKALTYQAAGRLAETNAVFTEVAARFADAREAHLREHAVAAKFNTGVLLGRADRLDEAIEAFQAVLDDYGDAPEPPIQRLAVLAAAGQGAAQAARLDDVAAVTAYDEATRRWGASVDPGVRAAVATAMWSKATLHAQRGNVEAARATYDELVREFADDEVPEIRAHVATALAAQAHALDATDPAGEAARAPDHFGVELETRVNTLQWLRGSAAEADRRATFATLWNHAVVLAGQSRHAELAAAYAELIAWLGDAPAPEFHSQLVGAWVGRAYALGQIGRREEAVAVYGEAVRRFGDASDPRIIEQIAGALNNRAYELSQLGRLAETISSYDEVVRRFADRDDPKLRYQVTQALRNRAYALRQLGRDEEALAAYDALLDRYGTSTEPEVLRAVANVLNNKSLVFARLGRDQDALAALSALIERFEPFLDEDAELRTVVVMGFENRGQMHVRLGSLQSAAADFDRAIAIAPEQVGEGLLFRGAIAWHQDDRSAAVALLSRARGALPYTTPFKAAEFEAIAAFATGDAAAGEEWLKAAPELRDPLDRHDAELYRLLAGAPGIDQVRETLWSPRPDATSPQ